MNSALGYVLAALVYPGALAALVAAWALGWARALARETSQRRPAPGPWGTVAEIRGLFSRETLAPEGMSPFVLSVGVTIAVAAPFVALVMLPLPGNPMTQALGLTGDLIVEAALLLGLPLARLLIGWATPSPYTRLAADRGARLLAGAVAPLVLGLAAVAQVRGVLTLGSPTALTGQAPFNIIALLLGGVAFLVALPVLTAESPLRAGSGASELLAGEASELSGHDLAFLLLGERLQLVASAALFTLLFVAPFATRIQNGVVHAAVEVVAAIIVAVGLGLWESLRVRRPAIDERPPFSWWAGLPILIGLAALVASSWATRG